MTTYQATFHTDGGYAIRELEADTPEQALAVARQLVSPTTAPCR